MILKHQINILFPFLFRRKATSFYFFLNIENLVSIHKLIPYFIDPRREVLYIL